MRVRTVDHSRVVFGGVQWGLPEVVIPLLAGSVFYADTIHLRSAGWRMPNGADALVSSPLHVQNLDGSVTLYEVQGGGTVKDDTLRDAAAVDAWTAWTEGYGVTDART